MRLVRSLGKPQQRKQPARSVPPAGRAVIERTVSDDVIPRLLAACDRYRPAASPGVARCAMTEEARALARILLTGRQSQATAFVAHLQRAGTCSESLLLNLLSPAARELGAAWEVDDCDFADVTIGMLRLANVMRVVAQAFEAESAPVQSGPCALLVQAPGEQHGFGVAMVASFFRRAGWNVNNAPVADRDELLGIVRSQWFSLVGLSVTCTNRLESLAADIRAIRAASRNRSVGIMVGGLAFIEDPQLARDVGADCTATDASRAVAQANALVSHLACRA